MTSFLRSPLIALAALSGFLAACNALLGVEEVVLGEGDPGARGGSAVNDGDAVRDGDALRDGDVDELSPLGDGEVPPAGRAVLSLGFSHTCARMPNGTVRCWGINAVGKVTLKPQAVPGINDAIAIGSGNAHTCITRAPGTVFCWGYNAYGQLGDGTNQSSVSPVAVSNVQDAVAIAGGGLFTCALLTNKTVTCWGTNGSGQLGDGSKTSRPTAAPVTQLADVASVSAGGDHACAVRANGDVLCWGRNTEGQLGIGSLVETLIPTKLSALSEIVQVAAANRSTCALQKSGRVYCWGRNNLGQLGNGASSATNSPSPALVPSVDDATVVWAGDEHVCALRGSGAVVCWGSGSSGQLGGGTAPDAGVATPAAVTGVSAASAVWAGGNRSCALAQDGRALCWGANQLGQLGNGTTVTASTAVPVSDFP